MSRQSAYRSKHVWNQPTNSGWYTAFENDFFAVRGRDTGRQKEYVVIDKESNKELSKDRCESLDFVKSLVFYITDMKNREIERIILGGD